MEIIDGMTDGTLVINNDNDLLRTVKYNNVVTIGIDNDSDYMAKDIKDNIFSASFYIDGNYINIPVGSKAYVYNSLFAYAVGKLLNVPDEKIVKSLESVKRTARRLELIKHRNYQIIDDTYNASLDSVRNALELLSKIDGRKVFIFGDILEADNYAKEIHSEIGNIVVDKKIDVLLTVGKNTYYTYNVANDNGIECYHYDNNHDMLKELDKIINTGDTILVKGSLGMNMNEIVNYLKEFKNQLV